MEVMVQTNPDGRTDARTNTNLTDIVAILSRSPQAGSPTESAHVRPHSAINLEKSKNLKFYALI